MFLEFRDAIHEGDGPRIIRCWKFMLLYWHLKGHTKYVSEAVHLISAIEATASERISQEIIWCRTVNTCGGLGRNIPIDLFLEHLNRNLKDIVNGLGPNLSENTIIQAGKSLKCLQNITVHFDNISKIHPPSMHHSKPSSTTDKEKIISELMRSNVFSYIPGRSHYSFKDIQPHISSEINFQKLANHIQKTKEGIIKYYKLKQIIQKNE
jgi:L1 cell adhesion molecule like protein